MSISSLTRKSLVVLPALVLALSGAALSAQPTTPQIRVGTPATRSIQAPSQSDSRASSTRQTAPPPAHPRNNIRL